MDAVQVYLRQFDDAATHRWESLASALEGVTEEEAQYQAACYRAEAVEEGWPLPGTIWWQVAHIAHCKRYYTRIIGERGATERPAEEPIVPTASFAQARAALDQAHAAQRKAIAGVTVEELQLQLATTMNLAEFLAMCIRHDTWHAAQIALARRLFRARA